MKLKQRISLILALSLTLGLGLRSFAQEEETGSTQETVPATTTTAATPTPTGPAPGTPTPTAPGNVAETEGQAFVLLGQSEVPKLKAGDKFNLKIPLVNWGNLPASDPVVRLQVASEASDFPFEIQKTDYVEYLEKDLEPLGKPDKETLKKKTQWVDFGPMVLREKLSSGYYRLTLLIRYRQADKDFVEVTRYFYIKVQGLEPTPGESGPDNTVPTEPGPPVEPMPPEPPIDLDPPILPDPGLPPSEESRSVPRIMVSGFSTDPAKVLGGQKVTLKLSLRNTSKDTGVKNIRMVLDFGGESPAFRTVSGSNSLYIEKIDKDSTIEVPVALISSVQAAQKSHPVSIQMIYEDKSGSPYELTEQISIPLYQESRVSLGELNLMPDPAKVGSEANLMFKIYNKGRTTFYNASLVIPENNGALEAREIYLGNIEPAQTKDVDIMVTPLAPHVGDFNLEIRYEDEDGKTLSMNQAIPLNIEEMQIIDPVEPIDPDFPDPLEPQNQGLPLLAKVLLGFLGLAAIIVVIAIVVRHRKKKQQEAEDQDLDL